MEAYKVKKGTKVKVVDDNVKTPTASLPVKQGDEIVINTLDGMYCNGINVDGDRIYIAAWTEVEPCC